MITVDRQSRVPVFEQIKNEIMTLIGLGVLDAHTKLPSIRQIAADTGVNVNTVKKAFLELEAHGVIYSVPGTGSFVSEDALAGAVLRQTAFRDIEQALFGAKAKGISREEVTAIVNKIFDGEEENHD